MIFRQSACGKMKNKVALCRLPYFRGKSQSNEETDLYGRIAADAPCRVEPDSVDGGAVHALCREA